MIMSCATCANDDKSKNQWIDCDICAKWYHLECTGGDITKEIFNAVDGLVQMLKDLPSTGINITYTCKTCQKVETKEE